MCVRACSGTGGSQCSIAGKASVLRKKTLEGVGEKRGLEGKEKGRRYNLTPPPPPARAPNENNNKNPKLPVCLGRCGLRLKRVDAIPGTYV